MTIKAATLISAQTLPSSVGVLYTCPDSTTAVVTHVVLTNSDSGTHTATLYVVPQGLNADATTIVLDAKSLATTVSYVSGEMLGVVLSPGDSIQGLASAASDVSIYVSGFTQT